MCSRHQPENGADSQHYHDTDSRETGWCSGCGRTDLAVGVQRYCPGCGMPAAPGDRYCEACGSARDRTSWVDGPPPIPRGGTIMTLAEAAQLLGLKPGTLKVQVHNGKLRARKVGRDWHVTPGEVERYRRESRRKEPTDD